MMIQANLSHYLSQWWQRSIMPYVVIRPQKFKSDRQMSYESTKTFSQWSCNISRKNSSIACLWNIDLICVLYISAEKHSHKKFYCVCYLNIIISYICYKVIFSFPLQVYRHGDRTPIHMIPNDIHNETTWPIGLGQLTVVCSKKMLSSRFHYSVFDQDVCQWEKMLLMKDVTYIMSSLIGYEFSKVKIKNLRYDIVDLMQYYISMA